jgi:hypothetical protein
MLIVCRKNLSQSDHMDCKIITIEGEEKGFLVGSHGCFQCFEILKIGNILQNSLFHHTKKIKFEKIISSMFRFLFLELFFC